MRKLFVFNNSLEKKIREVQKVSRILSLRKKGEYMRKNDTQKDKKQGERQLNFEFAILSSEKQKHSPLKQHLSGKKEYKSKQKNQKIQSVKELLPQERKELKLKTLSLEGVKTEGLSLKETPLALRSPERETSQESFPSGELFFENLISVEELAAIFRLAPQTIRNWVAQGKLPYVKIGKRNWFFRRSLQEWLNRKEEPQWR